MPRITFTSIEYDPSGVLSIDPDGSSDLFARVRRVNSTATLDGGRSFEQRGYTDADRTMTIASESATKEQHDRANYLIGLYSKLKMYTEEGIFLVTISEVNYRSGALIIRVIIQNKEV